MDNTKKRHQPYHIYEDKQDYFLSARIYNNFILINDKRKEELIKRILYVFSKYDYIIITYAILTDHYHLLFKSNKGDMLSEVMKLIHGNLSFKWNKEDNQQGRTIFQNYWDKLIESENQFWTYLNYIHNNPIKHGLVKNTDQLMDYQYCGYKDWLNCKGYEWMNSCWKDYPVIDYEWN